MPRGRAGDEMRGRAGDEAAGRYDDDAEGESQRRRRGREPTKMPRGRANDTTRQWSSGKEAVEVSVVSLFLSFGFFFEMRGFGCGNPDQESCVGGKGMFGRENVNIWEGMFHFW